MQATIPQKNLDQLAYNVSETGVVLGISRPMVYQLMKREDFPAFKVGSRTLISAEGLRKWVLKQAGGVADDRNK